MKKLSTLIVASSIFLAQSLSASDIIDIRSDYDKTKLSLEYLISDFQLIRGDFVDIKKDIKSINDSNIPARLEKVENELLQQSKMLNKILSSMELSKQEKSVPLNVNLNKEVQYKVSTNKSFSYSKIDANNDDVIGIYLEDEVINGTIDEENDVWVCIKTTTDKERLCFKKATLIPIGTL